MRYLLMIYAEETRENAMTDTEMGELMDGYYKFGAEAAAAGVMVGGERLKPISTATSASTEGGDFTGTDGPFAET